MDASQLLDLPSDDDLFARLGAELSGSESFGGDDFRLMVGRGRDWFDDHTQQLRQRICGRVEGTGQALTDVGAVAGTLSELGHSATTSLLIATIVVRRGLQRFCDGV